RTIARLVAVLATWNGMGQRHPQFGDPGDEGVLTFEICRGVREAADKGNAMLADGVEVVGDGAGAFDIVAAHRGEALFWNAAVDENGGTPLGCPAQGCAREHGG